MLKGDLLLKGLTRYLATQLYDQSSKREWLSRRGKLRQVEVRHIWKTTELEETRTSTKREKDVWHYMSNFKCILCVICKCFSYCISAENIRQAMITSEHAWNELSLRIDKSVILRKLMFWLLMGIMWWRNWKPSICSVNIAPWKEDIIVINNYTLGCITVHKFTVCNIARI